MLVIAPSWAAGGRRLLDPGAAGAYRKRFRIPESGRPQAHAVLSRHNGDRQCMEILALSPATKERRFD
jgi:hypothetical protein